MGASDRSLSLERWIPAGICPKLAADFFRPPEKRKSAEPTGSADRLRDPVSIGTLNQPLNRPRPQLLLSLGADSEPNVPGGPNDLFFVSGTDQVVQRLGLRAGNQVVIAGHQVQQRAGYLTQIDDVPAQWHPIFHQ